MGVDMEGCLKARHLLSKKLKILEKEAYKHAGKVFSLYMPADIANVLYEHLKLPIPEGHNKGKQHASTDKHCLDALRYFLGSNPCQLLSFKVLSLWVVVKFASSFTSVF